MAIYSGVIVLLFLGITLFGAKPDVSHRFFMSCKTTLCVRGLLAVSVLLCHIYAYYSFGLSMKAFNKTAFISVGMFFLLSGFGLVYSAINKKNYLKRFFRSRFISLYIPLWLSLILTVAVSLAAGAGYDFSFKHIIFDILGLNAIWFFAVIVVYYAAFYLIWRFVPKKYRQLCLVLFVTAQSVACCVMGLDKQYYTSSFGFAIGALLAEDYSGGLKRVNKALKVVYSHKIIFSIAFAGCAIAVGSIYIIFKGRAVSDLIFRNILCVLVLLMLLFVLYYVKPGNRISEFLGKISYEIFLIHPAAIILTKRLAGAMPVWSQIAIIIASVLAASYAVRFIFTAIKKHIVKAAG